MSRTISVKCPNVRDCGKLNTFPESDLVGEVPLMDENGKRIDPPAVEVDANTVIKCEFCGYPISCANARISD